MLSKRASIIRLNIEISFRHPEFLPIRLTSSRIVPDDWAMFYVIGFIGLLEFLELTLLRQKLNLEYSMGTRN